MKLFDSRVEIEARRLISALAADVPGDLGRILTSMIGLRPVGQENRSATTRIGPLWWAPAVLAICCRAYGRPCERAVPVGACLELLGVAAGSLDSAQDGEIKQMARHTGLGGERECGCVVDGVPKTDASVETNRMVAVTLNAAVALIGLMWRALFTYGPQYGVESSTLVEIGKLLADLSVRTCYGQHLDLTTRSTAQLLSNPSPEVGLSLEEYERLASDKSGELGGVVCEAAAVLSGAEEQRLLWRKLGTDWMTALQLKDDYVDLEDDLEAGRIGHPVLYGLEVADPRQKGRILGLLRAGQLPGPQATDARRELIALLEHMGTTHYTLAVLAVLRRQMLATLEALFLNLEEQEPLRDFVLYIVPEYECI